VLEFENTIRIDRPVDEVFAFLSDFENIKTGPNLLDRGSFGSKRHVVCADDVIPARGWVATGGWWKGHWPVFPATVHLPYATSGAPMITRVSCCLRPRLPSTPARPLCQERGLAVARRGADYDDLGKATFHWRLVVFAPGVEIP
jgi:hypothetical protein